MKSCWLLGEKGRVHVSEQGVSDTDPESDPSTPLLVGPSRTLRKHFRVPADLEGDRDKALRELFARYLPGSLEDYYCQFVSRQQSGAEKRDILGLAVNRHELDRDPDFLNDDRPVYILERLLAARSPSKVTLVSLPLPEGLYLGLLGETLLWGRFLPDPDETRREEARQSVRDQDPPPETERALPEFPEPGEPSTGWASELLDLLPASTDPAWDLRHTTAGFDLSGWRRPAWVLVILLILTLGSFWGVSVYERERYRDWVREAFRERFDRVPRFPVEELRSELNRARQRAAAAGEKKIHQYPRLVALDDALGSAELRVLRVELSRQGASMVLLTPTLEVAEEYLDRLSTREAVQSARIESTRSQALGSYRYQVNLQVRWEAS